jgi:hypothetical protein
VRLRRPGLGIRPGGDAQRRGRVGRAIDSVNAFTAALLARYAAISGSAFSVTLDVTLTMTPARRWRSCGSTACVNAIVPKVLVSKTSRTVAIGVSSARGDAEARVVDEHVDGPGGLDHLANALGIGDVERHDAQLL